MDGVTTFIREFSSDFEDIKDWKYTVEMYEEGIEVKYLQKIDDKMEVMERINISRCCAELLFKTIAQDFENHMFDD